MDHRSAGSDACVSNPSTGVVRPLGSMRSNVLWTTLGVAAYSGSQWMTVIALAKIGSGELVGTFALANAVVIPILLIVSLQMRTAQITDTRQRFAFSEYLGLRVASLAMAIPLVLVAAFFYRDDAVLWKCILAMGVYRSVEALGDVYCGAMQQAERMDRVAMSMVWKGPLASFVFLGFVASGNSIEIGMLAMCVVGVSVLMCFDVPQAAKVMNLSLAAVVRPSKNLMRIGMLGRAVLPIGIGSVFLSLNANVPRYFIEAVDGKAMLGIFAGIMSVFAALHLIQASIGQAILPRLSKHFANGDQKSFLRLMQFVTATAFLSSSFVLMIAWWFAEPLLRLIYDEQFAVHGHLMRALAVVSALQCLVGCGATYLYAVRAIRAASLIQITGCVVAMVLSKVLIPQMGVLGAAWALGVGMVTCLACFASVFTIRQVRTIAMLHSADNDLISADYKRQSLNSVGKVNGAPCNRCITLGKESLK